MRFCFSKVMMDRIWGGEVFGTPPTLHPSPPTPQSRNLPTKVIVTLNYPYLHNLTLTPYPSVKEPNHQGNSNSFYPNLHYLTLLHLLPSISHPLTRIAKEPAQ